MAVGPQETTLAPRGARTLAVLLVAICAATEVSAIVYGHLDLLLRITPWTGFVGLGVYMLFWAPSIKLTPAEVVVVNPGRTHRITWPAIEDVHTRLSLALVTKRGKVTVWAAPAPGPWSSVSQLRRDPLGRPSMGPADKRLPTTVAALAPNLVLRQWEAYRESGALHGVEGDGESARWHTVQLVVLGALLVLGIVAAILP